MQIFDCVIFFDENLLLDFRFNELDKYIKKFVIVKKKKTNKGKKKKLNFNFKKFFRFKNKIEYLVIDNFQNLSKPWDRENFQRNYISNAIDNISNDDFVMVSDADEIPNLKNLRLTYEKVIYIFEQKSFYYKINLQNNSETPWYGTRMIQKKFLKTPQYLRSVKVKNYSFWRIDKPNFKIVKNGGWHFSYLKNPQNIQRKIISFAHSEFNISNIKNINHIKNCIKRKKDLFKRDYFLKKIKLDHSFPEFILINKKKLKKWII